MENQLKRIVKYMANRTGYDVIQISGKRPDARCEGFDKYVEAANKAGIDVNDWIEEVLQWGKALPTLKDTVFPYLKNNACVCEIGSGTGRHARHILGYISEQGGMLHLFDHSAWLQKFLKNYFSAHQNVIVHDSDGRTIDMPNNSVDVIFSNGTFIEMKLGIIFNYSREFARAVKSNGYVIFNFFDISTTEGWRHLELHSANYGDCYTYHTGKTIETLFENAGFSLENRLQIGSSVFVVFKKL